MVMGMAADMNPMAFIKYAWRFGEWGEGGGGAQNLSNKM